MDLKIKDVAELLNVPEETVLRWLADGKIPAYKINQQFLFNRTEIEEWVIESKQGKAQGLTATEESQKENDHAWAGGNKQFSLYRAIHKGTVLANVPGHTKEEVIRATMQAISSEMNLDADAIADLLLERENLQPTALNNGIGIPHTRDFLLSSHHDVVTVVYPKNPIPYGALDGKPVHTLFFLFASDDRRHLRLLAKIAHLSSQQEALDMLKTQPNKETLLHYVKELETKIG